MNSFDQYVPSLIVSALLLVVIFVALRRLALWYWKVNDIAAGIARTAKATEEIARLLRKDGPTGIDTSRGYVSQTGAVMPNSE